MATMLRALLGFLFLFLGSLALAARPPATVIYVVRHGEKDLTPGFPDPPLTPAGEARARLLAQRLARRQLAALFTTDTRRTRATLAPLAQATGLRPLSYNAQEPAALAARLGQEYAGKAVVVVGHSNTLLPLLAALGLTQLPPEIKDEEYDLLFKVTLRPGQPARLAVSHYGAAAQPARAGGAR